MWTTVKDVLGLNAMQGSHVLAGHKGLTRQVKSVTILDAPDATLWLRGGELALTSTFPLNQHYANLNRFIPELVARDVAGLGVKLSRYMRQLPHQMIQQANELSFPILSIPDHLAWIEVLTPIFSMVLHTDARQMQHAEEIRNRFTRQLFSGASIEGLLALLYSTLGRPVFLTSPADALAIWQPNNMNNTKHIVQAMHQPELRANPIDNFPGIMHKIAGHNEIVYTLLDSDTDPYASIAVIIQPNEYPHHQQTREKPVIQTNELPFTLPKKKTNTLLSLTQTYHHLLHCRDILSMGLMQRRASVSISREKNNEYIFALTDPHLNKEARKNLIKRNPEQGLKLEAEYYLTLIKFSELNDHELRTAVNVLYQICEKKQWPIASKDNHQFVLFLPVDHALNNPVEKATKQTKELIKQVTCLTPLTVWYAGISQANPSVQLHRAYKQAEFALKHSMKTGQNNRIKLHDETGLYKVFSHPALAPTIVEYIEDWLGPVIEHDKTKSTRLLNTLRCFLENNGNHRETARQLHVHHNTIRYRLSRLSQLTRRDLSEPHLRIQFQLALLMYDSQKHQ